MLLMDTIMVASLVYMVRGYWRVVRYVPIALFFLLGVFGSFFNGLVTTLILMYVLSFVLAAKLISLRAQWLVLSVGLLTHLFVSQIQHPETLDEIFTIYLTLGGAFVGIALLQWFTTTLVEDALNESRNYSIELEKLTQEQSSSIKEKNILIQEIHHRVKNNLQMISSLLNMQSRLVKDPRILGPLQDSKNRVLSMAVIHEKLYQSNDLAHINLADYVDDFVDTLLSIYSPSVGSISIDVQVEEIFMDINIAIPFGMLINELLTNALIHAFPKEKHGRINIQVGNNGSHIELTVSDDGVGIPNYVDIGQPNTLGFQLVDALVTQVDGSYSVNTEMGTEIRIVIPWD